MKIAIVGAGVIGVSTAWYLSREGHEVTVIDRQPGAGLETSFANGGQISVSFCEPWASKSAPLKMLKWMTQPDSPLLYRFKLDPNQWLWGLQFLSQCNDAAFARNVKQLVNLGSYSQLALHEVLADCPIDYQRQRRGIMHFFGTPEGFADGKKNDFGVKRQVLERDQILAIEPAMKSVIARISGALYNATDESGDAHLFTKGLAAACRDAGVKFLYRHEIARIDTHAREVVGVQIRDLDSQQVTTVKADQYVIAAGSYSAPLLRSIGQRLAIYPAKGYSATLKLKHPEQANTTSLLDDDRKLAITRLGDSIRIAGTAELTGYDTGLDSPASRLRCAALIKRYEQLFPGVADTTEPHYWTGLRPSTPDNVPYIGQTQFKRLWVNAGHGTLGWTHGTGSGKALALLMSGRQPEFDFKFCGVEPQTYARGAARRTTASASGTGV
jgi:D-amino-acid dehydrogenase